MLSNEFACNNWQNVAYCECIQNIGSKDGRYVT